MTAKVSDYSANVVELMVQQWRQHPLRAAILTDSQSISYGQLYAMVDTLSDCFLSHGVQPGQLVGLSMGHTPRHLIAMLALAKTGAVSLPLHPAIPVARRQLAARKYGSETMVYGRPEFALESMKLIDVGKVDLSKTHQVQPHVACVRKGSDPMRIVISSGTSGDPKGMVLTHELVSRRLRTVEAGLGQGSRVMPMDMNFIVGFRPAMSALASGATLVFPRSMNPAVLLNTLIAQKVTHVYFSPARANAVVQCAGEARNFCPDIVSMRIGGGPVSEALLKAISQKLTPKVYVSYGSTESGLVTYATPEMLKRHPDTVGMVCDWAELQIVDEQGGLLPSGRSGEVRIRSQHQVENYLNDEEKSRHAFREGWFYPGDIGRLDESGLLFIEGRLDDQINFGGMKINPADTESVLTSHPDVREAGVFLSEDASGKCWLTAALVVVEGADMAAIRSYAAEKLGPLAPGRYLTAKELPRTETGKLMRKEMLAYFQSQTTRE